MLPLATQNSILVEWLDPFKTGFLPVLFQTLAGLTVMHHKSPHSGSTKCTYPQLKISLLHNF